MAQKNRIFKGVYENMDFGTYTYQEFPKHISTGEYGQFEVANNEEEELRILARVEKKTTILNQEKENIGPDPLREKLYYRAKELDVPINRKWSTEKLRSVIDDAERGLDSLAPEPYEFSAESEALQVPQELSPEALKEKLYNEARALGIPATKLWGIPRLRTNIDQHKKANPTE